MTAEPARVLPPRRGEDRHQPFACPGCGGHHWTVTDVRPTLGHEAYRRRRKCLDCGERITTYETREHPDDRLDARDRVVLLRLQQIIADELAPARDEPPVTAGLV